MVWKKYKGQCLICIIIVAYYGIFYSFLYPLVYSAYGACDEYVTLASSTLLNNNDWSSITNLFPNYYGYGYTMWFASLFKIINNPILRYQIMHVINALLHCVTALISYHILLNYFKVHRLIAICLSLALGLFYYEGISGIPILNELPLFVMEIIILWVLLILFNSKNLQKKNFYTILLTFLCIYSLTIHTRAFFLIGGVVVVIAGCGIYYHKSMVNIPLFLLIFSFGYAGVNHITSEVKDLLFSGKDIINNTVDMLVGSSGTIAQSASNLSNTSNILPAFVSACGRVFGIFTSSGGLLCIGVVTGIRLLFPLPASSKSVIPEEQENAVEIWNNMRIFSLYSLSMIFASLLMHNLQSSPSMLNALNTGVINKWFFYVRYHMLYFVPLLLIIYPYGKIFCESTRVIRIFSCIIFFLTGLATIKYILPILSSSNVSYGEKQMYLSYMPFTFQHRSDIMGSELIIMNFLIGGILLLIHIFIIYNFKKQILSAIISIATSVFIFAYCMIDVYIPISKELYQNVDDIYNAITDLSDKYELSNTIYYSEIKNTYLETLQYSLSSYKLSALSDNIDLTSNFLIISSISIDTTAYEIQLDETEFIYVTDKSIADYLHQNWEINKEN